MPVLERTSAMRGARFYVAPAVHDADCAMTVATLDEPAKWRSDGVFGPLCVAWARQAIAMSSGHLIPCTCGAKGKLMFVNVVDSCTRDGPRPATKADSERHGEAWAKFTGDVDDPPPFAPRVTFEDPPGGAPPRQKARAR